MDQLEDIKKPSKEEQLVALESYDALVSTIEALRSDNPEIEIEETEDKIKIPLSALKLLSKILYAMSQGRPISLLPIAMEMTTQKAADFLGCSRPHLVKLLESGEIECTKVGRHRRVKFEDVLNYKKKMKVNQKKLIIDIMRSDEELGLYDS